MLGFEFNDKNGNTDKVTPFGVYKFVQSLAIFSFSNVSSAVMSSNNSTADEQKYILYYLLSCGIFGFCAMTAMLFFQFKPEETEGEEKDFNAMSAKRNDHVD